MNKGTWVALIVALALVAVGAGYYWYKARPPRPLAPTPTPSIEPRPEATPEEPGIEYPAPQPNESTEATPAPLPDLDDSDEPMRESLADAFGEPPVEAFLIPDRVIRHIVATVDSLDAQPVRLKMRPITQVEGRPLVDDDGERLTLSPRNAERYDAYVSALAAADAEQIATAYLRYYPLFQRAYEEMGYPQRHFNDRVVAVIDHLLATPVPEPPVVLVRPKVLYQFADDDLERRSWGQKVLIRMGPGHAATVKQKLREIRAQIVRAG